MNNRPTIAEISVPSFTVFFVTELGGLVGVRGGFVPPGQHAASAEANSEHMSCGAIRELLPTTEPNVVRLTIHSSLYSIVEGFNPW